LQEAVTSPHEKFLEGIICYGLSGSVGTTDVTHELVVDLTVRANRDAPALSHILIVALRRLPMRRGKSMLAGKQDQEP
jgi:hypothetical protein